MLDVLEPRILADLLYYNDNSKIGKTGPKKKKQTNNKFGVCTL